MSVQASSWAWSLRGLPSHLKLTLLAIADACNADGYGYPGQERLGRILECSDRQVRRNVNDLVERGLLTVTIRPGTGGGRRSNAYQLHLDADLGNRTSTSGQPDIQDRRQPDIQDRATGHPGGGQPDIAMSYEPSDRTSDRTSECVRALCAPAPRAIPDSTPGFDRFWDAWPAGQRKRGRKTALAAWKTHHLEDKADMIVADVLHRSQADDWWLRGYAPMPQTYLRGARWEDELGSKPPQGELSPNLRGILLLEKYKCPRPNPGSAA